ncbi:MAG: hypothetical protein K0R34_2907 [Herbinix sp.]|jgi:hypothetical protein|nr:hypothetical protein [Herbinix sp.]
MIFTETSPVVQAWVRQIQNGVYTRDDVPALGNLREAVYSVLDKQEGK